jgi:hypothetical protein
MAVLHIALQEGFSDDQVTVSVDGREVLRRMGVSTRLQVGLAEAIDVAVDQGRHAVTVSARSGLESIDVEVQDEIYLGISLGRSGTIEHRVSRERFGYV